MKKTHPEIDAGKFEQWLKGKTTDAVPMCNVASPKEPDLWWEGDEMWAVDVFADGTAVTRCYT